MCVCDITLSICNLTLRKSIWVWFCMKKKSLLSYQVQLTMLAKQLIFNVSNVLAFSFSFQAFFKSSTCKPYKTYMTFNYDQFSSVQFSHSVVSDSLWPKSQQTRPPCPSPSPGVHSDSHPSSPWCHPAISSSVIPFSSYPQSLPASESFPMSQLFTWGGQIEPWTPWCSSWF